MYADEIEKEVSRKKSFNRTRTTGIDGKWKHDKYQTVVRANRPIQQHKFKTTRPVGRNISTSSLRGNIGRQTILKKIVTVAQPTGPSTLFLSNLAPTVSQADLEELFEDNDPEVVTLHFDANGTSLGTADLVVQADQVPLIQKKLEGVLLDGQQIHVLEANVAKQKSVFDRIEKIPQTKALPARSNVSLIVKPSGGRFIRRRRF